jgi:hypothetical protein
MRRLFTSTSGAVAVQAAQVDGGRAVGAVVHVRADGRVGRGQAAHQLFNRDRLLDADVFLADRGDRAAGLGADRLDARTGDLDALELLGEASWARAETAPNVPIIASAALRAFRLNMTTPS